MLEPARRHYVAIFIASFCLMMLELATARLLSVALLSHYAFVAVSLAMFGIGLGGLVVYLAPGRFPAARADAQIAAWLATFAVAAVASEYVFLRIHVAQEVSWRGLATLSAAYLVCAVPFFCVGVVLSLLMTHFARRIGPLYAADLIGAGAGCLAAVVLLSFLPTPLVPLVVAVVAAMSAQGLAGPAPRRVAALAVAVVALAAGFATDAFRVRYVKAWGSFYCDYEVWNAFTRICAFATDDDARRTAGGLARVAGPKVPMYWIDIDGTAWTPMMKWDGRLKPLTFLRDSAIYVAHYVKPRADTLVIGTGGGRDLLAAVVSKARSVRGIEINPLMGRVVEDRFADWSGRPYSSRGVSVTFAEGRSALPALRETFDILQLSLVDTFAAGAAGGFVFSENYLYTTEALQEYFHHLRPDGVLSITRFYVDEYPLEIQRLVGMAREAWRREGVSDFPSHVVVVAQGLHATMLAKRSAFTSAEISRLQRIATEKQWRIVYAPGLWVQGDPAIAAIVSTPDPAAFYRSAEYVLDPPVDDRPFFFHLLRAPVQDPSRDASGFLRMWSEAYTLMYVLLAVVSTLAAIFFLGPLVAVSLSRRRTLERAVVVPALFYFVCLGYGFMAIEIPLLQRLVLLVGYPTYALALGLGGLLVASGLGSLVSARLGRPATALPLVLLVAAIGTVAYAYVLPRWIRLFISAGLGVKVLAGLVALAPIGFVLGCCYPLGIGLLTEEDETLVPWAWGLNGATSVVASVLAVFIGSRLGFTATLLSGAAAYAVALVAVRVVLRARARRGSPLEAPVRAASGLRA